LGVVVALELTSLVQNMFCTLIFLGHSLDLCSTLEYIIQKYWTNILTSLTVCVLVHAINFVNMIMAIGTTSTFFFQLWQVSRVWLVLSQLVQIDADFVVITCIVSLVVVLVSGVVSNSY
jgi:hypothetical protein